MTEKNDTLILVATLIVTGSILGGGYWFFTKNSNVNLTNLAPNNNNNNQPSSQTNQTPVNAPSTTTFPYPQTVASGTIIKIDGSTSMVQINQALKTAFQQAFPGSTINTNAQGSDNGINDLIAGNIDIAAISRPLTPSETQQGLVAIPVTTDAIAIVIGINNPLRKGLTQNEIIGIFQGNTTNWSQLGSQNGTIRVINRPNVSGTRQMFQELVLNGSNFGNLPNFQVMTRDATTPILQALGTDGISYATYAQVANQLTIRTVAVDGLTPEAPSYPYQRNLYYVYKNPPTPAVEAFLGFATSPIGQQFIDNAKLQQNN